MRALLAVLAAAAGGLGCTAGCREPRWMVSTLPPIRGTNGTSIETALKVIRYPSGDPESKKYEEEWLRGAEENWIYTRYAQGSGLQRGSDAFKSHLDRRVEERYIRPYRHYYDVITFTLSGVATNEIYFDATNFRRAQMHVY